MDELILIDAIGNDDIAMVKDLIASRANMEISHDDGMTPLCYATRNGHLEIVKVLIFHQVHYLIKLIHMLVHLCILLVLMVSWR